MWSGRKDGRGVIEMSQLLLTVNGLKTWVCVKGRVHELRSSLMMVISVSCFRMYGVESEISSTM